MANFKSKEKEEGKILIPSPRFVFCHLTSYQLAPHVHKHYQPFREKHLPFVGRYSEHTGEGNGKNLQKLPFQLSFTHPTSPDGKV